MFRLTREVRFAVNASPDDQPSAAPTNTYAGYPSLNSLGHYYALRLTIAGPAVGADYGLLVNIKKVDTVVRDRAIPVVETAVRARGAVSPASLVAGLFERLQSGWGDGKELALEAIELSLSPFLCYSACNTELPMVRLSQKFEFSATHRLHNPALSDEENCRVFGKCNNAHGHGHNYEVQVTLSGAPDANGLLIDVPAFERIVAATVINRFDHKNLNVELPEFGELNPSVENIAMTVYRLLKPALSDGGGKLASVTVWETPKTWCEYSEG